MSERLPKIQRRKSANFDDAIILFSLLNPFKSLNWLQNLWYSEPLRDFLGGGFRRTVVFLICPAKCICGQLWASSHKKGFTVRTREHYHKQTHSLHTGQLLADKWATVNLCVCPFPTRKQHAQRKQVTTQYNCCFTIHKKMTRY